MPRNMHQSLILGILFTISALQKCHCQIPPDQQERIDTLIGEFINFNNVPGLGLTITRNNGELLYTRGYGFRDIENNILADSSTIFAIGSISKSLTATIVVSTLIERFPNLGESALDMPIRQLAPGYNFTLGDRYRSESTTFRDLLSHKACLLPEALGIYTNPFESAQDFLYRQRYAPEVCQFRTGFVYNNGLFALAGDVIAYIANSTFDVMLTTLLSNIGMLDSTFVRETDNHNIMPGRSVPYYHVDGQLRRYNTELLKFATLMTGSGGILTSARDMVKYMQFHLNNGEVGSIQIVPEAAMRWLYRPSNLVGLGSLKTEEESVIDFTYAYGLGLALGIYDGWQTIFHNGYIPPYESYMTLVPELNLGIFTTLNGPGSLAGSDFEQELLHVLIFDIVQGLNRTRNHPRNMWKDEGLYKSGIRNSLSNAVKIEAEDIVGNYGSGQSGQVEASLRINASGLLQPYMTYGKWGQAWLTQVSNTTFQAVWDSDITQMFGEDLLMFIEFLNLDTISFITEEGAIGTNFVRNLTIDQLPSVPWAPDSCGPEMIS